MTKSACSVVLVALLATVVRASEPAAAQLSGRVMLSEQTLPDAGAPAAAYLKQHLNTLRAGPDGVWRMNYAAFLVDVPQGDSGRLVLTEQGPTERQVWAEELFFRPIDPRVVRGSLAVTAPTVVANKKYALSVSVRGKVLAQTSVTLSAAPEPKLVTPLPKPSTSAGVKKQ